VRTVARGKRFLGSGVTGAVLALQSLTATERDILRLVVTLLH